ncbi:helix-turn-helix domain-containing protein [Sulfurovum sp. CS9]|uniref:helix-turn-helix domain-containing protein n=1 Tax=Sulfurovum sp. CS9 TaxID=3391146 RepID=UPI0039E7BAAF
MLFTVPLDKTVEKINIAISPSVSEFSAMHIISDQSIHFMGTFPEDTYPIVYTKNYSNNNKWHGHHCHSNIIKTRGDQTKIDDFTFNKTDLRFLLIDKKLFKTYLHDIFGDIDLEPIYSSMAYRLKDEDIDMFLNIHHRTMNNEKVSKEEISGLLSKIFEEPIMDQLPFFKGYDLIQRAISLMTNHLKDPLLIKELSRALDVSIRTLELTFKKHLNINPKLYYKRLLLLAIEAELRKTKEDTISKIINRYQIYDHSRFGARFKNYFEKTPSEILNLDIKNNPFGWNERIFEEFSEYQT